MREGICNILPGVGLFFSLAILSFTAVAIATARGDRPWYVIDDFGLRQQYSWTGRSSFVRSSDSIFALDPSASAAISSSSSSTAVFETYDQLGYSSLSSLYQQVFSLAVAACTLAATTAVFFLLVCLLRWLYDWEDVHTTRPSGSDRLQITYVRLDSWPLLHYFALRRRYGRALFLIECLLVLLSLATASTLAACVALFAAEHRRALESDSAVCFKPGPCYSFVGNDVNNLVWFRGGLAGSGSNRVWAPGPGWCLTIATLAFCLGLLVVAVAQLIVRNNRLPGQDERVVDANDDRCQDRGYLRSEYELLLANSLWQGQEKLWSSSWQIESPFATSPSTHHQTREEI